MSDMSGTPFVPWRYRTRRLTHLTHRRDQTRTLCGLSVFLKMWCETLWFAEPVCKVCQRKREGKS